MEPSTHRLGPVKLSITGDDPVCRVVRSELAVLPAGGGGPVDLELRFVDSLAPLAGALQVGNWRFAHRSVLGRGHGYRFLMTRRDTGTFDVAVHALRRRRAFYDPRLKIVDWNYLSAAETTAKNIMYELFDPVSALALLSRDAAYLHASTCVRDGRGTALVAWGGVGKTTSILKLITEDRWRYLSDDLGLLADDGTLWRTPKRLQVYAYNVARQNRLKKLLLGGRGPVDLLNWHLRRVTMGPKRVRRRVHAEELFGTGSVAVSAPLRKAIFLERADVSRMEWAPLDPAVMAERSAAILVHELNPLFELAVGAESHGVRSGIPGAGELREGLREVLGRAFDGVSTERLRIPLGADPDRLARTLRERL